MIWEQHKMCMLWQTCQNVYNLELKYNKPKKNLDKNQDRGNSSFTETNPTNNVTSKWTILSKYLKPPTIY